MQKIVITGIGPVTSIGIGKEAYLQGLQNGKSGIRPIQRFDVTGLDVKDAGELSHFTLNVPGISESNGKKLDLFSQYALQAAFLALQDAGLFQSFEKDVLVRIGVGIGGFSTIEEQYKNFLHQGQRKVSPFTVPRLMPNAAAGNVSIAFGLTNQAITVNSACASSLDAIADAYDKLDLGKASVALAGGTEACITPFALSAFARANAISKAGISRPFDAHRDGFVMGEGAGVLVLEMEEHALKRGAPIYAEMLGYGAASDGYHITAPDPQGRGLKKSIEAALELARITVDQVGYINAHGTSTPLNDELETRVFKEIFGKRAYEIPVSSTKSMIGHLIGAAGAVELIACVLAIQHSFVPPTINYRAKDPKCDLDYVPNMARGMQHDIILKTALGFGGHNTAMLIRRYDHKN